MTDNDRAAYTTSILESIGRRHATATVLFHQALAEKFALAPSDHKCLDLLRDHPGITASRLAALTGLTTGAIAGVVARLERAGYLRREPDPIDRRKQTLFVNDDRAAEIHHAVEPMRRDLAGLLDRFDERQLAAIAEFLTESTDIAYRNAVLLRLSAASGRGSAS
ncbi:MarR family winged helix-turn-helix transcriptional regulator [Nocardia sp. NPDC004068]|uniref:MarR family winged helix-turn-helix transcriptional regulator n=1 Tax=Nocardia sp. NPDC004068 TaxID=3364303 RepID=UPI003692F9F4